MATSWTGSRSRAHRLTVGLTGRSGRRADGHELDRPDLRGPRPVQGRAHQALEAREPGRVPPERSRAHESPAHRLTAGRSRAHGRRRARLTVGLTRARLTGWTGPTFEGTAHGPSPRSWTGSRSAHELVQEKADPVAAARTDRLTRAGPSPLNGRFRPDIGLQALYRPRSWTGSPAHGLTAGRRPRAGPARPSRAAASPGPGSRRAGLTVQLQGRAHESTAHRLTAGRRPRAGPARSTRADLGASPGAGLTVQGSPSGSRAHGPGPRSTRAGPGRPRTVQGSREPGSPAHGGPKATGWTGPTFEGRAHRRRAGLIARARKVAIWARVIFL